MAPSKIWVILIFLFFGLSLISISYAASQANISLSVDVYPEDLIVSPGGEVILQINLIQLLDQKRKDVVVFLSIIDFNNKILYESKQTIALETKASIVDKLNMPSNIEEGDYTINIEIFDVNEENLLGKASKKIIVETKLTRGDIYLIGIYLIVASLIVFIIMMYKHNKDLHRSHKQRITKGDIERYVSYKKR